ncbi:MAG: hypothetical protein MJ249_07385 [Kiritimatiellae bacterium]|nr:hypothetical protein [Kiritimatiellia bacterium]
MTTIPVAAAVPTAAKADVRADWPTGNLNVTSVASESVEGDIPDSALRRDDALGKLFDRVFSYPAPEMPNFEE